MSSQRVGHGVLEGSDHKVSLGLLSSELHGEKKKRRKNLKQNFSLVMVPLKVLLLGKRIQVDLLLHRCKLMKTYRLDQYILALLSLLRVD